MTSRRMVGQQVAMGAQRQAAAALENFLAAERLLLAELEAMAAATFFVIRTVATSIRR